MKNIILLLSILVSFVLTDIIKAEPVKLTFTESGNSVELEIIEVVGTSLQLKGVENKLPLAALDKESLIRVIAELGRQLKASSAPAGKTIEFRYVKGENRSTDAYLFFEVTNTTKLFLSSLFPKVLVYDKNGDFIGSRYTSKSNMRVDQTTVMEFRISNCRVEEIGSVKFEWEFLTHEDSNGKKHYLSKVFTPKAINFPNGKTK